jgi:hypothetical protein
MPKPLQISIPTPCHENWAAMTPSDKGRFCASCQKNVIDFTRASDREIAQALRQDKKLCGKFRVNQLERDLVIPKEKSSLWAVASAAVISFLTIGSNEVLAQEPVSTEQTLTQNEDMLGKIAMPQRIIIKGVISDETGPLPGATIINLTTKETIQSDRDGQYQIKAFGRDLISFEFVGYSQQIITIENETECDIFMPPLDSLNPPIKDVYGGIKMKSFFGRLFQDIGDWFR